MNIVIPKTELQTLLFRQVNNLFGLCEAEQELLLRYLDLALLRSERCFECSTNKYYSRDGEAFFNPFHSVQYMIFLYYLSNTIYKNETDAGVLCDKLYYLNKSLNAMDLFYTVELPEFFMAEHPVGTVIGGRGTFGNGFMFYQGCTVGGFHESNGTISYPNLGSNVKLFAHAGIIGRCTIGSNVNIGAGTLIKNQDIPDNVNVFGQSPNLIIRSKKQQK